MKTRIFLAAIILFSITSCNTVKKENSKIIKGELVHVVYFWLNNPENQEDVLAFEKAIKKLMNTNKLAVKIHLGKPASTAKRDVVDNSYNYCMIFTFPSLKEQRLYQDDPSHLIFIDQAKHLWKKVQVYDSMKESI
ncbi:MAG: Dabb family protein [Flavobacteriaceae bacterium]|jgi:hypothetical protein|nr:Dabb family protein [Flavobacteriaceae bacterium]MBT3753468.1 Dabb family protein [Flavobacteriaceae bacterium]MBT3794105.1 Dabb family protein [Flavobacteriaceae bacterium]MBT4062439.1 Dabb family protein [Flavobacteriaceae bacterium]MBT4245787.1 Dabb family protein [Flavobacteriaceae bacterium]|tara:strand:+ start:4626 stop:5033 length:408 start_codon:yes stop_codon:yes gene_type:complete